MKKAVVRPSTRPAAIARFSTARNSARMAVLPIGVDHATIRQKRYSLSNTFGVDMTHLIKRECGVSRKKRSDEGHRSVWCQLVFAQESARA